MVKPQHVSVVIPAHNEARTIGAVVSRLRQAHPELAEIIVVDDGSSDQTAAAAQVAGATVVRHQATHGYGASIKSGIRTAQGVFILTLDGDGQHQVTDLTKFFELSEHVDLAAGRRVRWLHSAPWRLPGKWLLRRLSSYLVQQRIPDLNCGLRLYRREAILRYLPLCSDGYSFTGTSLVLFLHRGYRVTFVPVDVQPNSSQGRVTVRTGFDVFLLLLRMATLLDPLRVFVPLSAVIALLGIAWGAPYVVAGRGISVGALLLLLTSLLLFAVGLLSDQIAQLRKERL
ncbi:MAG: glycosyltransferase family 2 protein [Candidatus Omnitrophica bacterium]|nr:glycosyltransferase family 2 protein [Candidatus Omnitrophota bacterium]MBI3021875.1 glycosyltransferase family 2 protein [Candidatus Omnitrophota bacterium]MBI3082950.1 glycosyltransferase family 2 protein [Candidatus Omnitrophota bacterium]